MHCDTTGAAPIERVDASAYTIPTERPESDGTLQWDATTVVVVEVQAGDQVGLGYTYAHEAAATLVTGKLAGIVEGRDALAVRSRWLEVMRATRNLGRPGEVSMAISAVDIALWDLKAKLFDLPLTVLLDAAHDGVPIYGSGGFTSYTIPELQAQLAGWAEQGIPRVKMKVGRDPDVDVDRVAAARRAIGDDVELYVDANGAYTRKLALRMSYAFSDYDVRWHEEPVTSDDLEGLRLLRDQGPPGMDIAAGEYGWDLPYFRRMLDGGAVDCLQCDVTRCGGITAVLMTGALCHAHSVDVSAHTAPQASAHVFSAVVPLRHLEYFHDHVRVERLLFDGVLEPEAGMLRPDRSRPGMGLEFKHADAERLAATSHKQ
ncbi:MAG: mandelate racemase [Actinobacteria bacterium]|nr:mandelate racemase [Actinomycetota bacterium]